jgi:choline dehydrogenase-like flavoprotein
MGVWKLRPNDERLPLRAFMDARSVESDTNFQTDLLIIGGGPAGISLALALANTPIKMLLLESGGTDFNARTQALYRGAETGVPYLRLDGSRLRYLGGSTNHWGGWCRPLDEIDFETRAWLPYSGWPIARKDLEPYFPHAQALVEAGPFIYDQPQKWTEAQGEGPLVLGDGGVFTTYFQFSKQRGSDLPTHFGERYGADLKQIPNLELMLHANVTGIRLSQDANQVDHVDVATLTGRHFTVSAKYVVVAVGGIENARLLLASNDVMKTGIGNGNDLVGRFFADHPIPGEIATLVIFDGDIAPYYLVPRYALNATFRSAFASRDAFKRARHLLGSLTTVDGEIQLDAQDQAAVAATAAALNLDATNMRAFSLGCGMEVAPDPDRRFTLTDQRDALGMPRLKLNMTLADSDLASYRATLEELGRQLLAARTGMLRIRNNTRAEWLATLDWGNHHMGTTRMSDNPKLGVVDADSRVYGVHNLYIAGSSIFPTYSASNPTMNLIALTLRLADRLKGQFR